DEVGAGEVAEGGGEHVDEAGEGPEREQQQGAEGVQLEQEGGAGHQVGVRLEVEHGAEPGGDGLAVVVAAADDVRGHGGGQAQSDGHGQRQVHRLVVDGGGGEHGADGAAPVDQDDHAADGGDPGGHAEDDREDVVGVLADAGGLGPALRDEQPADVAQQDQQDAEVEQGAADAQQPPLVELGGAGGPAELVVAVAPDVAEDEHGEADVRQDDPQQDAAGAGLDGQGQRVGGSGHRGPPAGGTGGNCGGAEGSRPTCASGGPSAARRATASRSSPAGAGRVAETE